MTSTTPLGENHTDPNAIPVTAAPSPAAPAALPAALGETDGIIAAERARIDALDARLIALVRDRMEISEHIQRLRLASGGRRVHLAREMEILDHYSSELGRPGRDLAMTLLGLCRGR